MRAVGLMMLLALLLAGCTTGQEKENPASEMEKIVEAKEIQSSFEEEYSALRQAIAEGDVEAARRHYSALVAVYERAREKAGEQHLQFMVAEEDLRRLGEQIERGDLAQANRSLSSIAGSCGIAVCHQRTGGAMANLEYEYSEIKKALREGDLERARKHFPEFKRYFFESREMTAKFLPEMTEQRMRPEYVENLE
ncbi:MAG: hypothetical protein GXO66_01950, partial [Euryarchaeota archaeon]|nr:hypothetical protein [Euryarchaeota archaeon]